MGIFLLKVSLVAFAAVNTACVLISRCLDKPSYWPSISEAGAKRAYPLYSCGGVGCAILLFAALCQFSFNKLIERPMWLRCLNVLFGLIMAVTYSF